MSNLSEVDIGMIIADARRFAGQQLDQANAASEAASGALYAVAISGAPYQATPVLINPPVGKDPGAAPHYSGSHFNPKQFTDTLPSPQSVGSTNVGGEPGNPPDVADFNEPTQPTSHSDTSLLAGAPTPKDITVPPAPDLMTEAQGIQKPDITQLPNPIDKPPPYYAPPFTGQLPPFDLQPPTDLDDAMRDNYTTIAPIMVQAVTAQIDAFIDREFPQHRTSLAKIEERLQKYLDGGSALSPEIENAIYSRTLDKTNTEGRRARDTAWKDAARAGFTMPTAYLLAKRQDIDQQRRDNNARAATDIAVKQAELEQSNLQFAVTQSANLRQLAINSALTYYGGLVTINGQALQYATSIVDAVVKAFDIAARYSETLVRIYEAQAQVYKILVDAELAKYQAYDAYIKGIMAQISVNNAEVELYKAQLEAIMIEANLYKAEVEGCLAQATLEKAKVDVYQARVMAYGAQVNADTAAWQGFSAACNGESAKVAASAEAVRAFSAQVQAYSAKVQAKGMEVTAIAASNSAQAQAYSAKAQAFSATVQAESAAVQAEVASFDEQLKGYTANAQAQMAFYNAQINMYSISLRQLVEQSQIQFNYLKESNDMRVAAASGMARVSQALAAVHGGAANAALSGMNTLASASGTQSE